MPHKPAVRTFFHFNEFRAAAPRTLRGLLYLSQELNIWGPSARLLDAHEGDTGIGWREMVRLLELEHPRVRLWCRASWFDPAYRAFLEREESILGWHDNFDKAIKGMAVEYPKSGPVVIAPDGPGEAWALEEVARDNSDHKRQAEKILAAGHIWPGTKQKVETSRRKEEPAEEQVKILLKDAFNHDDAMAITDSNIPFDASQYPSSVPRITGRQPPEDIDGELPDATAARNFVKVIGALARDRKFSDLLQHVQRSDLAELREKVMPVMLKRGNPKDNLRLYIADGYHPVNWSDMGDGAATLVSGLFGAMGAIATGNPLFIVPATLVFTHGALKVGKQVLVKAGQVGADYKGPELPSLVLFDTTAPTGPQIKAIIDRLSRSGHSI